MRRAMFGALALLVLSGTAAEATVVQRFGLEEAEDHAAAVLVGTVLEQRAYEDGIIRTQVTFGDLEVWKGAIEGPTVSYSFGGGKIGERGLRLHGVPRFTTGRRYVLFVASFEDPICPLVGWWQGRYTVIEDPADSTEAVADSEGRSVYGFQGGFPMLQPRDGGRPLGLSELESTVRSLGRGVVPEGARREDGGSESKDLCVNTPVPQISQGGSCPTWPTAQCTFRHDASAISGAYLSEFQAALAVWSSISGSKFQFNHGGATTGPVNMNNSLGNGVSETSFASLGMQGYAVTGSPDSGGTFTETDIFFNADVTWNTASTGNGNPHFRTVAIHEQGHALGLDHPPAGTDSIMDTSPDPAIIRSISSLDMQSVVLMYPGSGGPGPGPDPVSGADIVFESVDFSPADAEPGDFVTVTFDMRNTGTEATGPFYADVYLTGSVPQPSDRWLGKSRTSNDLAVGESGTGRVENVRIPTGLLPGTWRLGVILDQAGDVGEKDSGNNSGSSTASILVTRDAAGVPPGATVTGDLGPLGEDVLTLRLYAGAKLKLRGSVDIGTQTVTARLAGSETALATSGSTPKTKLKLVFPTDGVYQLHVASGFAGEQSYTLSIRAKPLRRALSVSVSGETAIPLPVFAGSTVTVKVKALGGMKPTVTLQGVESVEGMIRANKAGTRFKIGKLTAPAGELTLMLSPGDGPAGTVQVKVKSKPPPPKKAPVVVMR